MLQEVEYPHFLASYPSLIMAQSTRYGGVSDGGYASLNLGLHTGDTSEAVSENRRRFWGLLATTEENTAGGYQVHGCEIRKVDIPGYVDGYDALITNVPGILLTVTIADCVPILVFDPKAQAVAAIHAGWRGTVAQIAGKTIDAMQQTYGTNPADCVAYIGACIGYEAFEVSEEVAIQFATDFRKPASSPGKWLIDLKSANRAQLLEAGLVSHQIEVSPYCTATDHARFFSYRKEGGITGRMLAVAGIR